jgi:hypothetical protein
MQACGASSLARVRGISIAANAVAQSNDHILSFFRMLRTELAFYVGCLNLHEKLSAKGEPTGFPVSNPCEERGYSVRGFYNVCLTLKLRQSVVAIAPIIAGLTLPHKSVRMMNCDCPEE